ncbi:MAG: GntR family transcriptional regulator [Pseudomonadales bacterium]|nr:GntR family transcriptional regulator [Pseudomonadales bacterium]
MSRQNDLFKRTVNQLLGDIERNISVGKTLKSDSIIAKELQVSRSTVRKAFDQLEQLEVIKKQGTQRTVLEIPSREMYFDLQGLGPPKEQQVEQHFLAAILSGQIKPGDKFSELELARQSNCNTVAVREFLIRFSRFGLIEKKPRSQWQMKTFDQTFVDQLFEVRHLFEMHSMARFMTLADDSIYWQQLELLLADHKALKNHLDERFQEFSKLDQRFHTLLQESHPNQFISQFYEIISFVFHYHYQWDKSDEKQRNRVAIDEHIDIMAKMLLKDFRGATISLEKHLITAKSSLIKTAIYSEQNGDAAQYQ